MIRKMSANDDDDEEIVVDDAPGSSFPLFPSIDIHRLISRF